MHALVRGLVRQPGRARDIANGVEPGDAGRAMLVDDHVGAVDLHSKSLEAQALDVADDPHRDNAHVGLQGLGLAADLELDGDAVLALGELVDLGADPELQASPFESLLRGGRHLGVLDRHDAVEHLHHGDVCAQGPVEAGELDADGPRADHDQRLRRGFGNHGLTIGPHPLAVRLQTDGGDGAGPSARGQDHVLGLDGA